MKRLILDCDAGTDDVLALLILLKADKDKTIKIEAICCTAGNTSVENVCRNVVRILEITQRTDIPIYKGVKNELIKLPKLESKFHGEDGFGDLIYENSPDLSVIQKEPSPIAMNRVVEKYKNEIYLMLLGPLTNAALAMKLYPQFADNLKEIHIMGGNYKGVGNVTKSAEFNFHADPEAVYIILKEAKCPIVILPWEATLKPRITFNWRWNVFGQINHEAIQLLTRAEKKVYANENIIGFWTPCDAFLAAAFFNNKCIKISKKFHATIELHGQETRGQLVLDHKKNERDNVTIITKLNDEVFTNILLNLSTL